MSQPRPQLLPVGVPRRQLVALLAVISLVYLGLAVLFSLRTPAWENNDETSHLIYAEAVYAGELPAIDRDNGVESHQAPLYYAVVAGAQHLLGIPAFAPSAPRATEPVAAGETRVLKLSHAYDAQQAEHARWLHVLRLVSVVCGLLTVWASFGIAWLVTQSVATTAAVGAVVATWPKFLVVSAALTNSAMIEALYAATLLTALLWVRTQQRRWALATGVAVGLAALTQTTALPMGLMLLAVLAVWSWRRDRLAPGLALAAAIGCCGWWYVRNAMTYGDFLAADATRRNMIAMFGDALMRPDPGLTPDVLVSSLQQVSRSVWFNGGWNQLHLPVLVDVLLCAAAVVALGWGLRPLLRSAADAPARAVVMIGVGGSVVAWLLLAAQTTQAQGRYLLVAIPVWSLLLVLGTVRLIPNQRLSRLLWPVAFLAIDAYVVVSYLLPYGGL